MKALIQQTGFIRFLNRNYFIHSHLEERLDEVKNLPLFANFHSVIVETLTRLNMQIDKMEQLFTQLGETGSYADSEPVINFLEGLFNTVQVSANNQLSIPLLDYISAADALMQECAKIAEISIAHLQLQNIQTHQLYNASTLQALKTLLEGTLTPA